MPFLSAVMQDGRRKRRRFTVAIPLPNGVFSPASRVMTERNHGKPIFGGVQLHPDIAIVVAEKPITNRTILKEVFFFS